MNILTVEHLTKTYTEEPLFDDASFYLQEDEKVGVIGINGTGKSTLLKIISGIEYPDKGNVILANNMVVRYLPQHPVFNENETILQSIVNTASTKNSNAWEIESSAKTMLTKLGITDFEQITSTLSGGQKKRIALVSALDTPSDILVMDEPTNHLDNEMADWLEDYLKKWRGALIMVTHDRYFLDSVTNRIIEVDKGKIYSYQTNYSGFLELKTEREEMALASERKRQSILRTELEWIKRGARARSTKQKARIERYEELKNMKAPQRDGSVEISSVATRLGRTTIELENICKSYGNRELIKDFSYIFLKDDRVGFIGKNGCGKTTLMKMIAGIEKPDCGNIVVGQTVKIGYYTQEIQNDKSAGIAYMNPELKVIEYLRETAEYVQTVDGLVSASQMLEKFLFNPSKQYGLIGKLSGGEKRRLNLLRVLMEAPNVLILDEPTNDLDITTLTILEDYLDSFNGIVITVSHDRYFLDRTVRRIFAFEENGINQYEGGYSDYALRKEMEGQISEGILGSNSSEKLSKGKLSNDKQSENATQSGKNTWNTGREKKLKFTYNEQREYETIESVIAELEEKIAKCDEESVKYAKDFIKLNEIMKEKQEAEELLEKKMERWMYLEELADKIKKH